MNTRFYNNERAGLHGFGRLTTVILALALGFITNTAFAQAPAPPAAADDEEEDDPCKGVVFSSAENEELGCSVAAALHYGGTSLDSVRAHVARNSVGKRGAKWLQRFNKNLGNLAEDTFWAAFAHTFSRTSVREWTNAEFIEKLAESATRLDVLHQQRRTDLKVRAVRALIKAAAPKEPAPAPPSQPAKEPAPAPPSQPAPQPPTPKKVP